MPEYVLRPRQVMHRIGRIEKATPETVTIQLPWGLKVTVDTRENVGAEIYYHGIFDKIVPEAIWRLADPGESAVDVGANIGQNTSVMAHRVGIKGEVHAFEPHPVTYPRLAANRQLWPQTIQNTITLHHCALGPEKTTAYIKTDCGYLSGSAVQASATAGSFPIDVERFDDALPANSSIGVCKIDVEGHELGVLQGATETLRRRGIRDIIFEDFEPQPSPVTRLLTNSGFTVFELHEGWLKPSLQPIGTTNGASSDFSYNYLATLAPDRALARFKSPGWHCLLAF
jgi:FkbM family methyltransferase